MTTKHRPRSPFLATLLALALAAGCAPPTAKPAGGTSPGPTAARPTSPAVATKPASGAAADLDDLPTDVTLPLPSSLVAAGGGNMVAAGAGNMIGQDGGSLVAAGGGNMVAAGAGNYGLLAFKPFDDFIAKVVKANTEPYFKYTGGVNAILAKTAELARAGTLKPGVPLPVAGSTYLLERAAGGGGLLTAYRGGKVDAGKQTLSLRFASKRKGAGVYRDELLGVRFAFATTFDLDAGEVTADNLVTPRGLFGNQRTHWTFLRRAAAAAGQPAFEMRVSAYHQDHALVLDGLYALSANFLADGRGAAIGAYEDGTAGKEATGAALRYLPNQLKAQTADNAVPHDFYLDAKGEPLATPDAALKAVLPGDGDLARPFVANPAKGDPFADPAFTFPD